MKKLTVEGDVDRVVQERFFPDGTGVFVEVGAARPDYLSISASFRGRGWLIVATEPNPAYQEAYRQHGIEVLPYACGELDEDDVDFCVVDSHNTAYEGGKVTYESFSSLSIKDSYAALRSNLDVKSIKVKLRRLDTIMAEHAPNVGEIDVVSVDVEGWEIEVLRGLSFPRFKPKVLIVENLFSDQTYRNFMATHGYRLWRVLSPNEVYVRNELLNVGERVMAMCREWVAALLVMKRRRRVATV